MTIQTLFMKCLLSISLLIATNSICQTVHGVKSGVDSTARVFNIKSKAVSIIKIDSGDMDTVWTQKYNYLPNGYLKRFEETDVLNLDTTHLWVLGYHFIEFEYNQNGYLIDEKVQWDGPVNVPVTPDSTLLTTKRIYKNDQVFQEIIVQTQWYDKYESFTDTTITTYNTNGSIAEIDNPPYSRETYIYNENGLLSRIEYTNSERLFKIQVIKYEFYE